MRAPARAGHQNQRSAGFDLMIVGRIEHPSAILMGGHKEVFPRLWKQLGQRHRRKAGRHHHFLDAQPFIAAHHLVHEIDDMRAHHGRGNAHAAGEVGRDGFIGAGAPRLARVAHVMHARHHPRLWVEQFDRQRHHEVLTVVSGHCKHAGRCHDPCLAQGIIVGRIVMQVQRVRVMLQPALQRFTVGLDDHRYAPGLEQLIGHVGADAANAAHDVVTGELGDVFFHAFFPQGGVEIRFEQQSHKSGKHVAHRANANHGNEHGEQAPYRVPAQIHGFTVAYGGHGDEGHVKAVNPACRRTPEVSVAERAHHMNQQQQRCAVHQPPDMPASQDFFQAASRPDRLMMRQIVASMAALLARRLCDSDRAQDPCRPMRRRPDRAGTPGASALGRRIQPARSLLL